MHFPLSGVFCLHFFPFYGGIFGAIHLVTFKALDLTISKTINATHLPVGGLRLLVTPQSCSISVRISKGAFYILYCTVHECIFKFVFINKK
jgi:hypothetical protein